MVSLLSVVMENCLPNLPQSSPRTLRKTTLYDKTLRSARRATRCALSAVNFVSNILQGDHLSPKLLKKLSGAIWDTQREGRSFSYLTGEIYISAKALRNNIMDNAQTQPGSLSK